jgi:hypothetical protein
LDGFEALMIEANPVCPLGGPAAPLYLKAPTSIPQVFPDPWMNGPVIAAVDCVRPRAVPNPVRGFDWSTPLKVHAMMPMLMGEPE